MALWICPLSGEGVLVGLAAELNPVLAEKTFTEFARMPGIASVPNQMRADDGDGRPAILAASEVAGGEQECNDKNDE